MEDVLDRKRALCLLQIIETGSVRGAAEVLELDPSVVSRAVAKLEQDTGLALLERRGRGVVATDAGRLLALFARRQQDLNDTFLAEVNNLKNAQRGHVELSFGEGFVDLVLEPVLQGFLRKHPDVTCSIQVAGTDETVRLLLEDLAHIGFVFQPPDDARLHSHYSRLSPIRAHVHKDHPLARRRRALTLADLAQHQGAFLAGSFGVRKHVQAAELDEHITLKPMLVTNSFKVLWEYAAMGLGYILTARSVPLKEPQLRQLVSLPLANPILNNSRIHILTRAGRHLSPVADGLLRHLVKAFPTA
ncbi:LysR family transcriptional regulator [Cupriavidus taiwanensis]|uniref:LysR family transcriptional regulator n=1 Tax=Cupriavidus taiwanensis TaxID=164546 RepID=UPI000E10D712|nr:LysR family transcriptional regulator [Cupriavidus taiwanensis]SPA55980.1 putative transcription regulator, LysR family [Cupriavidus taiwanensis]